jgi:hypothetical protein
MAHLFRSATCRIDKYIYFINILHHKDGRYVQAVRNFMYCPHAMTQFIQACCFTWGVYLRMDLARRIFEEVNSWVSGGQSLPA